MSIKREIYELLQQSSALTARQIASCINRSYSTWLRSKIDSMVTDGDLSKEKRHGANGRPVFVYRIAKKYGSIYAEYCAERSRGYPFTYELWLEDKIRELRSRG